MCRGASAAKRLSRTHGLLRGAFERAGFREVVVEIVPSDQRFPSLDSLPEMRPILDQIREASRDAMWQEIEMVMRQFEQSDGVIVPTERLVGRIAQVHPLHLPFRRGEEKAVFRFGGSAIVVFGERGKWSPSADLLEHTLENVETLVRLGDCVVTAGAQR
jgi:hypothetical protein